MNIRGLAIGSTQSNIDAVADACQTEPISTEEAACQMPELSSQPQDTR